MGINILKEAGMNKQAILALFESQDMKFGDVKKIAKTIKVNHDLAY
jgi:hypothetical protein